MSSGSLREAYSLAHTAQCRLNIEAGRPDRNLRFVVGHLMHYESLRLRIVEIEHDISRSHRNANVTFKGTGHFNAQNKPSPLRKSSPPPPETSQGEVDVEHDSSDSDDLPEDFLFDDEEDDSLCGLGLQRFPSGSARPSNPLPELVPDNPAEPDDEDEDDPPSPPDKETLDEYVQGDGNVAIARLYNRVHKCHCHGKTDDTPEFQRMWKLPPDKESPVKDGVKTLRAVAQVA